MCGFFSEWFKKKEPDKEIRPREQYNPQRLNEMGRDYENGKGLPLDLRKALECYRESSDLGYSPGTFNLGRMYFLGLGTTVDKKRGLALMDRAASEGCREALRFLGYAYFAGEAVEKDRAKALGYLRRAADKGDRDAMYSVGIMYKTGDGTPKNPRLAFNYLDSADRLGHPLAHEAIYGKPTPVRPRAPEKKVEPSPKEKTVVKKKMLSFDDVLAKARSGQVGMMYEVGMMYLEGRGVDRSPLDAINWLRKSARGGNVDAMVELAKIHSSFSYGSYAPGAAVEWYTEAALAGRDECIVRAVEIYRTTTDSLLREDMFSNIVRYGARHRNGIYSDLVALYAERDGREPTKASITAWLKRAEKAGVKTTITPDTPVKREYPRKPVEPVKYEPPKKKPEPVKPPEKKTRPVRKDDGVTVTRTYRWKYYLPDGRGNNVRKDGRLAIAIRSDDYLKYARSNANRQELIANRYKFVTPDDPYVKMVADRIKELTRGHPPMVRANCAIKFVQSFRYTSDQDQFGQREYVMFPLEMLWTQTGDCEDFAILFTSIMRALGFQMVLLHMKTNTGHHMASAVCHRDAKGYMISYAGKKYYYCEATSTLNGDPGGMLEAVGEKRDKYTVEEVIPVP